MRLVFLSIFVSTLSALVAVGTLLALSNTDVRSFLKSSSGDLSTTTLLFPGSQFGQASLGTLQTIGGDLEEVLEGNENFELLQNFTELFPLRQLSNAVGRLDVLIEYSNGKTRILTCTGTLVSPTLVLTANHCIEPDLDENIEVKEILMRFGYLSDLEAEGFTVPLVLQPVDNDSNLDFALLEIDRQLVSDVSKILDYAKPVPIVRADPDRREELLIVHHPYGRPLRATRRFCRGADSTTAERGARFPHQCDTLQGSSGAPILRASDLAIIGIHVQGGLDRFEGGSFNWASRITQIAENSDVVKELSLPYSLLEYNRQAQGYIARAERAYQNGEYALSRRILSLAAPNEMPMHLAGRLDGLLAMAAKAMIGESKKTLQQADSDISALSASSELIASGSWKGDISVTVNSNNPIPTRSEKHSVFGAPIFDLDFSPDGVMLASISRDGQIKILNSNSFETVHKWSSASPLWAVRFINATELVFTDGDGRVYQWEPATGMEPAVIFEDEYPILHLEFSTNKGLLLGGDTLGRLLVIRPDEVPKKVGDIFTSEISDIAIAEDRPLAAAAHFAGIVRILDLSSETLAFDIIEVAGENITSIEFLADASWLTNDRLIIGTSSGNVYAIELSTGDVTLISTERNSVVRLSPVANGLAAVAGRELSFLDFSNLWLQQDYILQSSIESSSFSLEECLRYNLPRGHCSNENQ